MEPAEPGAPPARWNMVSDRSHKQLPKKQRTRRTPRQALSWKCCCCFSRKFEPFISQHVPLTSESGPDCSAPIFLPASRFANWLPEDIRGSGERCFDYAINRRL